MASHELPPFVLVTGNPDKLREARQIVGDWLDARDIDLPEIQSLDLEEVLRAKAEEAHRRHGGAVAVEETGLEMAALGGFPGPLVKWMLKSVGPEGLARTALALDQPGATVRCLVLYYDGERSVMGEGIDRGRLVLPPRGEDGFGWDPVFVPEGEQRTWSELGQARKDRDGHRGKAWVDLVRKLLNDEG